MEPNNNTVRRFRYADYLTWPEDERWELIDGIAYAITPGPDLAHQDVSSELLRQIANFLHGGPCKVLAAPFDVRLPETNQEDADIINVVQPDLSIICDTAKLDKAGCRGAPDWIIEILSPSTAAKDQDIKRTLYERHGVREYWLVHPTDLTVMIYRLAHGAYTKPQAHDMQGRTPVSAIPGLEINWNEFDAVREAEPVYAPLPPPLRSQAG